MRASHRLLSNSHINNRFRARIPRARRLQKTAAGRHYHPYPICLALRTENDLARKMVCDANDILIQSSTDILQPLSKPRKIRNNKRDWRMRNGKSSSSNSKQPFWNNGKEARTHPMTCQTANGLSSHLHSLYATTLWSSTLTLLPQSPQARHYQVNLTTWARHLTTPKPTSNGSRRSIT